MSCCIKGAHQMVEIYRKYNKDGDEVVRWCNKCGGITIDLEWLDGTIEQGKILRMLVPRGNK